MRSEIMRALSAAWMAVAALLAAPPNVAAQVEPIEFSWSNEFTGHVKYAPTRHAFHVTNDNVAYATGTFPSGLGAGTTILTWRVNNDTTTAWQRTHPFASAYDAFGIAITTDPSGSIIFVAGVIDSAFGKNTVVVAYAPDGTFLWTTTYTNESVNSDDLPVQILSDGSYVYVAGDSTGALSTGASTNYDYFVIKLNTSDGTSAWGNQAGGSPIAARYNGPVNGQDVVAEMQLLSGESGTQWIYVAGTSAHLGSLGTDLTVIRIDAITPTTIIKAATGLNGNETCTSMTLGGGQVFVTGYGTTVASGTVDYVTFAYSNSLVANSGWPAVGSTFDGGNSGIDRARRIAYSATDGTVVVTGESWQGSTRKYDVATVKLNTGTGGIVWGGDGAKYFNNSSANGDDIPSDMVIDKCGNVYVGGRTLNGSTVDFHAVSYKPNGDLRWQEQVGGVPTGRQYITHDGTGSATDFAAAIRVTLESAGIDHSGDVFLFGEATASGGISKYGIARWDQIDPCGSDPSCCN